MSSKKDLGVVLTPPKTAEYIISRLGQIKEDHKVLDPCVGPGVFVKRLLERGIKKSQIFTYDINPAYKNDIERLGVSFEAKDTLLSINSKAYNEFDLIVGNPPYLNKASSYVGENRAILKKIYGKINAHETYSMFIVNSIWRLKNGGKLGFITSDSFLTLSTHKKLRRFILDSCIINEILLGPSNLFDNQNVSTSPAIIILTKCPGTENKEIREENVMRIVPSIKDETEYKDPKVIQNFKQKKYNLLPFNIFFSSVEKGIINLFERSSKLENHIKGYIGMHTHDNLKFIAAVDGTELADIFKKRNEKINNPSKHHKIIIKEELKSNKWKPYLKRGGGDQYYRPIMEALEWSDESIPKYDIPNNVPFEVEGIVISGVSSRLAARYISEGCYWDSNKAIGFTIIEPSISIEYALGLLNSSLYNYLAKGIINNTSSIQITGIHSLPFLLPDNDTKEKVELLVKKIIKNKMININYDYTDEQKLVDDYIFKLHARKFGLSKNLKLTLDKDFSSYQDK